MARGNHAVLAPVSRGYSPLEGRLVTCYSPSRHCTHGLLHFLVRLACVRHAASVDSEPGSNSRLKPVNETLSKEHLALPRRVVRGSSQCSQNEAEASRNAAPALTYFVRIARLLTEHFL